jgi:hypothetical protein
VIDQQIGLGEIPRQLWQCNTAFVVVRISILQRDTERERDRDRDRDSDRDRVRRKRQTQGVSQQ